jgi:hypothetical protein
MRSVHPGPADSGAYVLAWGTHLLVSALRGPMAAAGEGGCRDGARTDAARHGQQNNNPPCRPAHRPFLCAGCSLSWHRSPMHSGMRYGPMTPHGGCPLIDNVDSGICAESHIETTPESRPGYAIRIDQRLFLADLEVVPPCPATVVHAVTAMVKGRLSGSVRE